MNDLSALPNVRHIGIGMKTVGGLATGEPAVIAFVDRKQPVGPADAVPARLATRKTSRGAAAYVATDVVETPGRPRLFSLRAGLPIFSADREQGTSALVFSHASRNYLLTNAHVVTDPGAMPGPVGVFEPQSGSVDWANTVIAHDVLSPAVSVTSDAALVRVDNVSVDPWKIFGTERAIDGFADVAWNDTRIFSYVADGVRHECALSAVIPGGAPIDIDGAQLQYVGFFKFRPLQGLPRMGDSGALIYTPSSNGLLAAALLFGGIPGEEIWAFPARRCYDQMIGQLAG